MSMYEDCSLICAMATPPGKSAISVIRLDGVGAKAFLETHCSFLEGKNESHKVYYGYFKSSSQVQIDEVLVTYFQDGKSFTGNESLEISCHGSPTICQEIISELVKSGARLAEKGEFSYRAFINGKLDLAQAESVLNLIQSTSKVESRVALDQLKGNYSKEVKKVEETLTLILAHLEASIDFSLEDLEVAPYDKVISQLIPIKNKVDEFVDSYSHGKKIKEGIKVSLVGPPNSGKSSFLNSILGFDKALVTNVPGTTRDIVEGSVIRKGIKFNFLDTAGVRDTSDLVEELGIKKTYEAIDTSDYIFVFKDCQNQDISFISNIAKKFPEKVILINTKTDLEHKKIDLLDNQSFSEVSQVFNLSIVNNDGFSDFENWMDRVVDKNSSFSSSIVFNLRHFEHFSNCSSLLLTVMDQLESSEGAEFIATNLHIALQHIYGVLGKAYDDEVMDRVFNEFCIGK